jgi:hypothetical protein
MYCDKCDNIPFELYTIEEWKKRVLIEIENFRNKLNNKINGLNCIIEITMNNNTNDKESESFIKQCEDVIDTIFVNISHIDNFNQLINDLPISHIIKRKNTILNNKIVVPIDSPNSFVNMILSYELDIHADNNYALKRAVCKGCVDIVECLIKYGADIHNNHFVQLASSRGYLDVVECLIKHGADIHADNNLAIKWASEYGHLDVVKRLISHGADIHIQNDRPLFLASNRGHLDVVKYLIANGSNINDEAITRASQNGHTDIVEYLTNIK